MLRMNGSIRALLLAVGLAAAQAPGVAFAGNLGAADNDNVFRSRFELYNLTITNYLARCAVAIDVGGGELGLLYPEPATTLSVTEGHSVLLQGLPMDGFVWGYWSGIDAVGYSSSVAWVTMSSDREVRVCCLSAARPSARCP